jgi:LmbE family N-acetylglucosaminyl deacetylase
MEDQGRVLVVAAHPDDEVLGCAGTMARLAKEGHEVYVAILGEGVTSRYKAREEADQSLVHALHGKSRKVSAFLGVKDLFSYSLPDNRFDTIPLLELVKVIEELVERLGPRVIYTHHGSDLNIDHALTHRAVMTATRPTSNCPVKEVYAFEVPSSTEWSFHRTGSAFHPNVFVDISTTLEFKIRAMGIYDSEVRAFPHPRSAESLRVIARRWGSMVGVEAAEAMELVRLTR